MKKKDEEMMNKAIEKCASGITKGKNEAQKSKVINKFANDNWGIKEWSQLYAAVKSTDDKKFVLAQFILKYPLTPENLQKMTQYEASVKIDPNKTEPDQYFRASSQLVTQYFTAYRDAKNQIITSKEQALQISLDMNAFMSTIPLTPREIVDTFIPVKDHYLSQVGGENKIMGSVTKNVFMLITASDVTKQMSKFDPASTGKLAQYMDLYRDFLKGTEKIEQVNWERFSQFLSKKGFNMKDPIPKNQVFNVGDELFRLNGIQTPTPEAFEGFLKMIVAAHKQVLGTDPTLSQTQSEPDSPRSYDTESSQSTSPSVTPRSESSEWKRGEIRRTDSLSDTQSAQIERVHSSRTPTLNRSESQENLQKQDTDSKNRSKPSLLKQLSSKIKRSLSTSNEKIPNGARSMMRESEQLMQGTLQFLPISLGKLGSATKEFDEKDLASAFKDISSYFQQSVRLYCQTGSVDNVDRNLGGENAQLAKNILENGVQKMVELLQKHPELAANNKNIEGISLAVNRAASEGIISFDTVKKYNEVVTIAEDKASLKK